MMGDRFECSSTESARYHRPSLYKVLVLSTFSRCR